MSHGHADKWGPLASIFAALCCLGVAPVLGALTALGLGFLIKDIILIPLLVFFLGMTIWALHRDRNRHGRPGPQWVGWLAALLTLGGLWISAVLVGLGLVLLMSASVWNVTLIRQMRQQKV